MTPGSLDEAMAQKSRQLELPLEYRGEAPKGKRSEQASSATTGNERPAEGWLMEEVLTRPNLMRALKRVRKNRGSPGIDGMTVAELPGWLRENWPRIREQLLDGTYQPQPVRRATIPKPGGGERQLGIPSVLDRLIQQALLQVLQPRFDPTFSEHSHGFRPGRSAHGAIREAQQYIQNGKRWVVDVDLEKFFDRVNHDVLMGRLAKRIGDRRILRLIRRYLGAGVMAHGVVVERYEGTPQGGPLSPLLANVLLDKVDKQLENAGMRSFAMRTIYGCSSGRRRRENASCARSLACSAGFGCASTSQRARWIARTSDRFSEYPFGLRRGRSFACGLLPKRFRR